MPAQKRNKKAKPVLALTTPVVNGGDASTDVTASNNTASTVKAKKPTQRPMAGLEETREDMKTLLGIANDLNGRKEGSIYPALRALFIAGGGNPSFPQHTSEADDTVFQDAMKQFMYWNSTQEGPIPLLLGFIQKGIEVQSKISPDFSHASEKGLKILATDGSLKFLRVEYGIAHCSVPAPILVQALSDFYPLFSKVSKSEYYGGLLEEKQFIPVRKSLGILRFTSKLMAVQPELFKSILNYWVSLGGVVAQAQVFKEETKGFSFETIERLADRFGKSPILIRKILNFIGFVETSGNAGFGFKPFGYWSGTGLAVGVFANAQYEGEGSKRVFAGFKVTVVSPLLPESFPLKSGATYSVEELRAARKQMTPHQWNCVSSGFAIPK